VTDEAEQRQARREADRDDHHPHRLHDGDSAHISIELDSQAQHLRKAAGCCGQIGGKDVPAVYDAQIGGARDADGGHGSEQHGDTERIGRDAVQRRRRHDGAERNADQYQQNANQQRRHQHRAADQRSGGDRQN